MTFKNIKLGETSVSSLDDIVPYLDGEFKGRKKEKMLVVGLNGDLKISLAENFTEISEKANAWFSVDKIFKRLKETGSMGFVLSHNHPTGFPLPSEDDIKLTKEVIKRAKKEDMVFMEHILCAQMTDGSIFHWAIIKNSIKKKK